MEEDMMLEGSELEFEKTGRNNWTSTNKEYNVQLRNFSGGKWYKVSRNFGRRKIEGWEILQSIKNKVVGESVLAVEVYPKQEKLRNGTHCRHLWVLDGQPAPDLKAAYIELGISH